MTNKVTGATLKYIALVAMILNSFAQSIYQNWVGQNRQYEFMVNIGRIAFPICCFLLVEGFRRTKDIKKYILRMLLFACISEIPFDTALFGKAIDLQHQNVMFELALGLICMWLVSKVRLVSSFRLVIHIGIIAVCGSVAFKLNLEHGHYGILLIMLAYYIRCQYREKYSLILGIIWFMYNKYCALAFIPISLYKNKRGKQVKVLFYAAYPLHLIIFAIIRMYVL